MPKLVICYRYSKTSTVNGAVLIDLMLSYSFSGPVPLSFRNPTEG